MIYVLDTDILSLLAHKDSPEGPRIRRRVAELRPDDSIATTIVNYEEQIRGWMAALGRAKSSQSEIEIYNRLLEHLLMFRRIPVLPYNAVSATTFERFRKERVRVGTMDLKIAAIAMSSQATLITRNLVDFKKIADLPIEDWSIDDIP